MTSISCAYGVPVNTCPGEYTYVNTCDGFQGYYIVLSKKFSARYFQRIS